MALTAKQGADGKVIFLVEADGSKIPEQMKKVGEKIKSESEGWGASLETFIGKKMDSLVAKVAQLGAAFGKFIVDYTVQSIELAKDLDEINGQTEAVFGKTGYEKIDRWSKNAAKSFGVAEIDAKKYAAQLGTIIKMQGATGDQAAQMTEQVGSLAFDIATAYNSTPEEVTKILRNALEGSATGLKNLIGVDLSAKAMGNTYAGFSKMDTVQQLGLRYKTLMDWAAQNEVAGSFLRAQGTINNAKARAEASSTNLQGKIGEALLPTVQDVYTSGANFAENLSELMFGKNVRPRGELTADLAQNEEELAKLNDIINREAQAIGKQFGLSEEMYQMQGYQGSYGEWVFATLRQEQPWLEGEQRKQVDSTLADYEGILKSINDTEIAIAQIKQDLAYLDNLEAEAAAANTAAAGVGQSVADGLSSKRKEIDEEVKAIKDSLSQLGNTGVTITSGNLYVPHASGLDYVPYDNYHASLHAGESVLTAQEAKVWRSMKYNLGTGNGLNYDALGSTMRDNVRAGGNVYLDGQAVGRVISARQADAYRAMERSGFQQ